MLDKRKAGRGVRTSVMDDYMIFHACGCAICQALARSFRPKKGCQRPCAVWVMSIINRFSVVIVDFFITSKSDKLSVSIEIGIVWLVISSMSFLIAKVMSKASAKAIVSLPRTDLETLF